MQVIIVISQHFRSNLETDNLHFTRFEKYLLKTFQLFHRTGTAADDVADIKLYYLRTGPCARVGDCHCCGQRAVHVHAGMAQVDIAVRESGIRKSVTERIEWLVIHIEIVAAELLEPFTLSQRASGVLMRIIKRDLSDVLRESHRQFAARVDITEEGVADSVGRFATSEPYIQNSGHVFLFPV